MCGNHWEMWLAVGIIYCGLLGLGFCWALEAALQGLGGNPGECEAYQAGLTSHLGRWCGSFMTSLWLAAGVGSLLRVRTRAAHAFLRAFCTFVARACSHSKGRLAILHCCVHLYEQDLALILCTQVNTWGNKICGTVEGKQCNAKTQNMRRRTPVHI